MILSGEIHGLVGESGAGKSTLGAAVISLLQSPGYVANGTLTLGDTDLRTLTPAQAHEVRGNRISMIFQDPQTSLNPLMTIEDQLIETIQAHSDANETAARKRAVDLLEEIGIKGASQRIKAYPHQFSGGMRQRVVIALAICTDPELIIADEPTTAFDVSIQAQILFQMRELAAEMGTAMVWISHDLAVVSSLASKLAVMYAGRIVEQGPTATLLRDPRHPYTAGLISSLPAMAKPGLPLHQIPGATPSLLSLPPGCPFAPRCERATKACDVAPDMTFANNRGWRCFHPVVEAKEATA